MASGGGTNATDFRRVGGGNDEVPSNMGGSEGDGMLLLRDGRGGKSVEAGAGFDGEDLNKSLENDNRLLSPPPLGGSGGGASEVEGRLVLLLERRNMAFC